MSRRKNRHRRRNDRIRKGRMKVNAEKLRQCIGRDACDHPDCIYFLLPESVLELINFVDELLKNESPINENKGESAFAFAGQEKTGSC